MWNVSAPEPVILCVHTTIQIKTTPSEKDKNVNSCRFNNFVVVLTVPSGTPISCAELLRDPQGKLRYHTTFISINTHVSYFNDKTLNTVPAGNSNSRKPSPEFSLKTSQWFSLHVTFIQERSYANLSMTNTKGLLQNYSILSLLLLTCSNRCSDCVQ